MSFVEAMKEFRVIYVLLIATLAAVIMLATRHGEGVTPAIAFKSWLDVMFTAVVVEDLLTKGFKRTAKEWLPLIVFIVALAGVVHFSK